MSTAVIADTVAVTDRADTNRRWSLLGTTVSLIAATGVTSVLGMAFWWLATHRASLGAVGNGSAAVSAMTLVGTFGMIGLNTTLIPHLARRTHDSDGLLAAGLCAAALVSAALAAGLWLTALLGGYGFAPYLHAGPEALVFIGGSALTGASLVLDEALLGLVGGTPQLWRNCAFAVTKLAALAGFTVLWHDQLGTSILTAWAAGTALSLAFAAALLRLRGVRLLSRPRWAALRGIGRSSAANTWLNNTLQAPGLVGPMLVTGLLGAEQGGAFYVAYTVLSIGIMLSFHFTTALYAANAADPGGLAAKLRFTLRVCLLGGVAGLPLAIVAARPLLHVFGAQYATRAALPLMVMLVGYFGSVLKNHYVALLRIADKITTAAVYSTVTCVVRLAAMAAGGLAGGLAGVSVAMLVSMTAEGLYTVPALRAALKGEPAAAAWRPRAKTAPAPTPSRAPGTAPDAKPRNRARVVYHVQPHGRPAQVARLVRLITEGSPHALVLISHGGVVQPLDVAGLQALGNVRVLPDVAGYGDFAHVDRYLAAVDWLDANRIEYDWLENLAGEDYPLRPIAEIEEALAATDSDGFLQYAPVLPERIEQRAMFGPDFACYGGSSCCTLRADCARYVRDYARANPAVVMFFRTTLAPDKAFIQTALVNSGRFTFTPDTKRYNDQTTTAHNHPRTLRTEDAPAMLASGAHWARELDLDEDAKLFDILDARIRRGPAKGRIIRSRGRRPLAG
jgi:O-antigen/teichoic acid export membrane protein